MTARTRPRPTRAARPRKGGSRASWRKSPLLRPEALGVAIVALSLAALPWLIDLGTVVSQARDWVARTFGLGILGEPKFHADEKIACPRGHLDRQDLIVVEPRPGKRHGLV